ncbi:MAG: hypothetical protein J6S14_14350 [Clostridia bacterium]|nr:hypothetical protein [Clostridia bacterium]
MSHYARDVVLRSQDKEGNTYTDYPITRADNVILNGGETVENALANAGIGGTPTAEDVGAVPITGGKMTGNLEISKGIPTVSLTVPGGASYAEIKKNAGADVDMGTNINDFASAGNYTQLNLCHADKALRLRVTENGVATGAYDIYHEGNKPTAADVGAVAKGGDTMTGDLRLNPANNGYSVVKKNATSEGDWGLQLQDNGADGSFMGITISATQQKLEFKKKAAGSSEYTYPKIYASDDPPQPDEVGAVPIWGGTMTGALTLSGFPYQPKHAACKEYVDGRITYGTEPITAGSASEEPEGTLHFVIE